MYFRAISDDRGANGVINDGPRFPIIKICHCIIIIVNKNLISGREEKQNFPTADTNSM